MFLCRNYYNNMKYRKMCVQLCIGMCIIKLIFHCLSNAKKKVFSDLFLLLCEHIRSYNMRFTKFIKILKIIY